MIGGVGLSMALFGTILTYYAAHQVLGSRQAERAELVRAGGERVPLRPHRPCGWRSF